MQKERVKQWSAKNWFNHSKSVIDMSCFSLNHWAAKTRKNGQHVENAKETYLPGIVPVLKRMWKDKPSRNPMLNRNRSLLGGDGKLKNRKCGNLKYSDYVRVPNAFTQMIFHLWRFIHDSFFFLNFRSIQKTKKKHTHKNSRSIWTIFEGAISSFLLLW